MLNVQRARCSWACRRTAAPASCGTTRGRRSPRSRYFLLPVLFVLVELLLLRSRGSAHCAITAASSCNTVAPTAQVAPFCVAAGPVTIGEFYAFAITARGYEQPEFWDPEDSALFAGRGQVTAHAQCESLCVTRLRYAACIAGRPLGTVVYDRPGALCHMPGGR